MNVTLAITYFFITLAALSAFAILFSKNVFKSALLLLICLLSVSGLYVLAFAEFVAVTQILIYAGGILVVIIFGIMLTTKISGKPLTVGSAHIFTGALSGVTILILLARYLPTVAAKTKSSDNLPAENISVIGLRILVDYSLPFEVAGILLLIALIGAAVITSHLKSRV